ncbi:bacillithiol biosynthesis cysteine-adding enzyme BshC [Aquimarina sp. TRL1]|uniref:bacillithiol biosynthesis cysteine-adding enzyme BshC n=1 Tax=Aquimarina sp. (strain TRL1) TaxID=2736252 RepID=UPI00158AC8DA|nr:bacillithiol biosynthesis cysteine-adding enzyme BshC [Aquimarina sp. TRL1]QKX05690.1 bacillithiol biosynthesis cysteine-adding enzyme BshC [Aquimarina sp. TRL1]
MPCTSIPFRDTHYFSSFICDYLDQKPELKAFYNRFPTLENFGGQIEEKQYRFSDAHRDILATALEKQYHGVVTSEATLQHIKLLREGNTFTVTTGHQLNLFTGPLYFLYKILSTINLCETLKKQYPSYNFVPVYWMATEDHDFDEINYFRLFGKKIQWNKEAGGAVGNFTTEGLDEVLTIFSAEIGKGKNAMYLKKLFEAAYIKHDTLSAATRYLANELFSSYGLVIVDGDDKALKSMFVPYVKRELEEQLSYETVLPVGRKLVDQGYKMQVNPREINLFYLSEGVRERIVKEDHVYRVFGTSIRWSKEDVLKHVEEAPERFSPNVIMRPLYQEVILPNLCYIGGGGELAYWLELKQYFAKADIPFPMLLLRNSVLVQTTKQAEKIKKLSMTDQELFLKQHELINRKVRQISNIDINFDAQRLILKEQFKEMLELAKETDVSFANAVRAQETKQLKGLDVLEKRLLKAQRRKLSDQVVRLTNLQNALFPGYGLQERTVNFSELYLEFGEELIKVLKETLDPLLGEFLVIKQ